MTASIAPVVYMFKELPCTRMHEQGRCDGCWCPCISICVNDTLAVDSPFQKLMVDFSSNL